jgi:flagellar hook protein FlgE
MSIFGAMSTAISGLNAQSAAFTNISDNVANSSTVGFKGVNTSFIDYLTQSTATTNQSGSVVTRPDYTNDVQGSIAQSSDALALAITGKGMFAVSELSGDAGTAGTPVFNTQQFYTRAGDFSLDRNGYVVNSAGEYLDGWMADPVTGVLDTSKLVPIQVATTEIKPVPTSAISVSANVPATPTPTSNLSSEIQIYDAGGTAHTLQMQWAQTGTNAWTLSLSSPDNQPAAAIGSVNVTFNPDGTLATLSGAAGNVAVTGTGGQAAITLAPNFGGGPQPIVFTMGTFGSASGITQFAGTDYDPRSSTQNGVPAGNFTGIETRQNGDIVASFDTGQTVVVAHVPIAVFADPDALQRQNGQAFTATAGSGPATLQNEGVNGAGALVTGSVEDSNVDIATELSKLIVAQQAYSANAKMITAANQLMQVTIDMKQ